MSSITKKLIIVESPTKAKTISRFLGKEYIVESSFGHLRDLPKKKMGIDIANDFQPEYEISDKSKKRAGELKRLAKKVDEIILASDEDREGEAIAWHLVQILGVGKSKTTPNPLLAKEGISSGKFYKRIVFHEITKNAILEALKNPRDLDMNLVDAQQARRILDRLVGYELSPFLWKKIRYGLSAGRVQSVAVRLIAEREEEIRKFKSDEYWSIESEIKKLGTPSNPPLVKGGEIQNPLLAKEWAGGGFENKFRVKLIKIDDKAIPKLGIKSKEEAEKIKKELEKADYKVGKITKKEVRKNPLPPFTTSTLQQAANNQLGYSAKQTMMLAQQLYEGIDLGGKHSTGLITYMRTDSLNLSGESLNAAEEYIKNKFSKEYAERRFFKTKSKGAQEAHEAIRPSDPGRDPESVKNYLDDRQYKLYKLIWQRMVASQMASAVSDLTTVDVLAELSKNPPDPLCKRGNYTLRASGSVIKFEGFLKVYPVKLGNENFHSLLPLVKEEEKLDLLKVLAEQHFTQPPPRYTEASLVKKLEEEGIGRPSTYAPTLSTIQDRGYVEKIEKKFHPKDIGEIVNKLLVEHFPKIVDLKFTAKMEEDLDEIAEGKIKWVPIIKNFYQPFKKNLMEKEKEVNKKDLTEESTEQVCEKCGSPMIIKLGRFGKFLACSNYPDCKNTKQINEQGEVEEQETTDEVCEKCGKPMVFKQGRFGKFLGCSGYPDCRNIKSIAKSTGVKCPECNKGEIVEKKSKKGKTFFACNQYPDCKFALWNKPTGSECSNCGSLMVFGKGGEEVCSNKECGK